MSPPASNTLPGYGTLHLSSPGQGRSTFSTLNASYPLKLLSPSPLLSTPRHLGTCYLLAYGGGLVAGDEITLKVVVSREAGLLLLTQGSTKVFRIRPGIRPQSLSKTALNPGPLTGKTIQRMHVTVEPDAFLLLLPSPIQPYARSSYYQAQRIHLTSSSSSVILLDWFTAGRTRANDSDKVEEWDFERYSSLNEVVLGANVIMREKTVLENQSPESEVNGRSRTIKPDMLADRMNPYQTYATILIYGPHFRSLLDALSALSQDPNQRQFQTQQPNGVLLWSFSLVEKERGGVLRLAGMETEVLAEFIRGVLERGKVDELVGRAMWERIW